MMTTDAPCPRCGHVEHRHGAPAPEGVTCLDCPGERCQPRVQAAVSPPAPIDTINDSLVGVRGDGTVTFAAPWLLAEPIPPEKALRMAAWVVAMADRSDAHADFLAVLAAVECT